MSPGDTLSSGLFSLGCSDNFGGRLLAQLNMFFMAPNIAATTRANQDRFHNFPVGINLISSRLQAAVQERITPNEFGEVG